MRINTKVVIDMATYAVLKRESFEYPYGRPVAQCCGGGPGGGGSAAGVASTIGEGDVPGAGPVGVTASPEAAAMAGGLPGGAGDGGPGISPQVSFSIRGAEIGAMLGGFLGPPGAAVGSMVGGVIGSAIAGSGVPGGMDMSGEPAGTVGGPDIAKKLTKGTEAKSEPGGLSKATTPVVKEGEPTKTRKRPETILTSPLGLRSRPNIRRATLLGG